MKRQYIAVMTAIVSLFAGFTVRLKADSLSHDVVSHQAGFTVTKSYDESRHVLLQDIGAVFLAYGTLVLVLLTVQWVIGETRRSQ